MTGITNRIEMEDMLVSTLMSSLDDYALSSIRSALEFWVQGFSDLELHNELIELTTHRKGTNHE